MEPSLVAAEDQKFCPLQYDDDHISNNSPFVVLIYLWSKKQVSV